ncbi:Pycsar system effector family protein [Aureitalea marina]|uniref:Phosphohydrolase n=1 Tax=Aureitalea marina TaxID=930804 RepID=A0A2S7KTI8_9FLAO|nr:Pycsar system effector family protein [Aureitalea marina]PQB05954.1 phosphohydrolase [Aureitalea marina]
MTPTLEDAKRFVTEFLVENLPSTCLYHNLTHTKRVVKSTKEIIDNSELTEQQQEVLQLAALFHDTGYCQGGLDHEKRSAEMARNFLTEKKVPEETIKQVEACIMATRMEAKPEGLLEEIIRDADASHFAKDYFQEASEFLRLELKMQGKKEYSRSAWLKENIAVLENWHQYYTDYAKENWGPKKEENLKRMKEEQQKIEKQKADNKKTKELNKQKAKSLDPDKAIQSVFRVTLRNHIKLSDIADTKANILLSVNAIIISIALTNLIPKLDNPKNAYLMVPTLIFLFFSVISIIMSILATRPNVTKGRFTKDDVNKKKVNLLFFGNFHQMSLNDFQWAMNEMLQDKEYIYNSLTKDLYFLGLVLERKYRILRITYTVFMVGMVVSVIAFAIAFISVEAT